jgi:hypothetical protein
MLFFKKVLPNNDRSSLFFLTPKCLEAKKIESPLSATRIDAIEKNE